MPKILSAEYFGETGMYRVVATNEKGELFVTFANENKADPWTKIMLPSFPKEE